MQINVDRQDLLSMIKGINPSYEQMSIPAVDANGWYSGSYDKWSWSGDFKGINDQELYELYIKLKG